MYGQYEYAAGRKALVPAALWFVYEAVLAVEDDAVAAGRADFQRHLGRFYQRYVVVHVAYGHIERYREFISGYGVAYHRLHALVVRVGLVVGELPY